MAGHFGVAQAAGSDTWTALPEDQWFNPLMHHREIRDFVTRWDGHSEEFLEPHGP